MFKANDGPLENETWTPQYGSDINAVSSDAILAQNTDGPLEVYEVNGKPYGGALVTCKRNVPSLNGKPVAYAGLDFEIFVPKEAAGLLRCIECDLKLAYLSAPTSSTKIPNVADWSAQLNLSEGGMWQIDSSAFKWTDTGYKPGPIPVETWTPVSLRYKIDTAAGTFSVLSIAQGSDKPFLIPASLQSIPLQVTNWDQVAAVQLQLDDNTAPGAFEVEYRNIFIVWGDKPF